MKAEFHASWFVKDDDKPLLKSVNIEAETIDEALTKFINEKGFRPYYIIQKGGEIEFQEYSETIETTIK